MLLSGSKWFTSAQTAADWLPAKTQRPDWSLEHSRDLPFRCLSLSFSLFLDVFCLSALSGGPHPLSFLISISFSDFWFSDFSPLCLILNLPLPSSFVLSLHILLSLAFHTFDAILCFLFSLHLVLCPYFSWFCALCVLIYASLNLSVLDFVNSNNFCNIILVFWNIRISLIFCNNKKKNQHLLTFINFFLVQYVTYMETHLIKYFIQISNKRLLKSLNCTM